MTSYQEKLSTALGAMLDNLQNNSFDLKVQIYSTTQYVMSNTSNYDYAQPTNSTQQILRLDDVSCTDGVTTKSGYCTDRPVLPGFQIEKYSLKPPTEIILPNGSDLATFTSFKTSILDTVRNMGVSGSDTEQAMCTLARILTAGDSYVAAGEKVGVIIIGNENDSSKSQTCANEIRRKFLPDGKRNWSTDPYCKSGIAKKPDTSSVRYIMKYAAGAAGYIVNYQCSRMKDGKLVTYKADDPYTYRKDGYWVNNVGDNIGLDPVATAMSVSGIDITKSCLQYSSGWPGSWKFNRLGDEVTMMDMQCPDEVRKKIRMSPTCGYYDDDGNFLDGRVEVCNIGCNDQINYGQIDILTNDYVPTPQIEQWSDFGTNFCESPFDLKEPYRSYMEAGKVERRNRDIVPGSATPQYTNMFDLFSKRFGTTYTPWTPTVDPTSSACCRIEQFQLPYPAGEQDNVYTSVLEPLGLHTVPIREAVVTRANQLLGSDGYFISTIIHTSDPALACPMDTNESVGVEFENLVASLTNKAVLPICSADYSPALDPLRNFITTTVGSSAVASGDTVELSQGDQLVKVYVVTATKTLQFPIGGPTGVWPTLQSISPDGLKKTYKMDFSKTGYTPVATDRIFGMIAKDTTKGSIDTMGGAQLTYDAFRSLYRIGLGH